MLEIKISDKNRLQNPKPCGSSLVAVDALFNHSNVAEWIGDQWRDLGPAALGLDPSDLERINLDSLEEMLDELGTYNFSKSQAQALIKAAKNAWKESGKDWFLIVLNF